MEAVIREAINDALETMELPMVDFVVEHPKELSHGDYACNVAMVLSREVGQAPRAVAEQMLSGLTGQIEYVERIEIAGPGFLNFHLSRDFFSAELARAVGKGEEWGKNDAWEGKKVVVEYTSPNLFKPLHIGNLVGNIIGESITRLFEYNGAEVKRFNYPSDIGLTVAKGVWGLLKTENDPKDITAIGDAYRIGNEAYEAGGAEAEEIKSINKALYEGTDPQLTSVREQGIATSKTALQAMLARLGTNFDHEITESVASIPGQNIVKEHIDGTFVLSDGAVVYPGEKVGLHTRVFLNSQGLPTYEAKDLGHFKLKHEAEPDWDHSVIVTGNEQREYFKVIFAVIEELWPEFSDRSLEHIPTGFLTLTTGKMSSRKGNVLTGESLLADMVESARERAIEARADDIEKLTDEIAVAALKYQILRSNPGTDIVFDKEKSLSFEGDSGPYLQYTYARALSVLEKAKAQGVTPKLAMMPETPYQIERILYRFPEVVVEALRERAPHHVVTFLTQLAGEFNTFYAHEKIADSTDEYAPYKALLTSAVATTLKNGLRTLGIKAPERL
ncbi:MAG: arginine--tRNA ligase [Candidatus Paceibacteria bacterium]